MHINSMHIKVMVPTAGVEPAQVAPLAPQTSASTNFATSAFHGLRPTRYGVRGRTPSTLRRCAPVRKTRIHFHNRCHSLTVYFLTITSAVPSDSVRPAPVLRAEPQVPPAESRAQLAARRRPPALRAPTHWS